MTFDAKRTGRIVGILLLVQALVAIPVYTSFGLMGSITTSHFLTAAAADADNVQAGVMLTLVLSAISIAITLTVMPLFRLASERMFWLYFLLTAVGVTVTAIESAVIREMLAMSVNYSNPRVAGFYDALAPAIRAEWASMRFFILATGHLKALVFFLILYRFHFVPRQLAGVGVLATIASTAGATAALAGAQFSYYVVAPAGLVQLATALWLMWRGLAQRAAPAEATRSSAAVGGLAA